MTDACRRRRFLRHDFTLRHIDDAALMFTPLITPPHADEITLSHAFACHEPDSLIFADVFAAITSIHRRCRYCHAAIADVIY